MATYPELVQAVSDWSNRDTNVLSYSLIKTFINYAADNAYRTLRIAPLEQVVTYNALTTADVESQGDLIVPTNLIEFIQLRRRRTANETNSPDPFFTYDVYAAKSDAQSFYQGFYWKGGDQHTYFKERNRLRVYPAKEGDIFELYYYRRLPNANETYEITNANAIAGNLTLLAPSTDTTTYDADFPTQGRELIPEDGEDFEAGFYYTTYVPNWLVEENEKVLLFGALAEAFDYLDEAEQSQKYHAKFEQELFKLNNEDKMRMGSGGNIQIRYDGNGLI